MDILMVSLLTDDYDTLSFYLEDLVNLQRLEVDKKRTKRRGGCHATSEKIPSNQLSKR